MRCLFYRLSRVRCNDEESCRKIGKFYEWGGHLPVELPAIITWTRWPTCRGIPGHHTVESVATFLWNHWPSCCGIGGHHTLESLAIFPWNTQPLCISKQFPNPRGHIHSCIIKKTNLPIRMTYPLQISITG